MGRDGASKSDIEASAGNINDAKNIALATAIHGALVSRSKMYDLGVRKARFDVIRNTTIPAAMIMCGFLSNEHDAKLIATSEYRELIASSIVQAVQNYRRAVGAQTGSPQ